MKIIETAIEDVVIIEPRLFKDERGYPQIRNYAPI